MISSVRSIEIFLISFLSSTIISEGLKCTNGAFNGNSSLAPVVTIDGKWSAWQSCDVICVQGSAIRRLSCLNSVLKNGNSCNDTEPSEEIEGCETGATSKTLYVNYTQWSPWLPCDVTKCGNDSTYDLVRSRRACVTSRNRCNYIDESEQVKMCNNTNEGETPFFKVVNNTLDTEFGWRIATVVEAEQSMEQVISALQKYEIAKQKKWIICRLAGNGSIKGSMLETGDEEKYEETYGYEIKRNISWGQAYGWGEKLLIQLDIMHMNDDVEWSRWSRCSCLEVSGEGNKSRHRTCVTTGEKIGTRCNYTDTKVCMGGLNSTLHGAYKTWSSWASCDVTTCGDNLKGDVRIRTTCVNYAQDTCTYLRQIEERTVCHIKDEPLDIDISMNLKIKASLGTWGILLVVFVVGAGILRSKEVTSRKAMAKYKNKTKPTNENDIVIEEREEPTPKSSKKGKTKKRKKNKEDEIEFEMIEEKRVEVPLLEPMPEEC